MENKTFYQSILELRNSAMIALRANDGDKSKAKNHIEAWIRNSNVEASDYVINLFCTAIDMVEVLDAIITADKQNSPVLLDCAERDVQSALLSDKAPYLNCFIVKAKDDAMFPLIQTGDDIYVSMDDTLEDGALVYAVLENNPTVRRFYRSGGGYKLIADNKDFPPLSFLQMPNILGRVIKHSVPINRVLNNELAKYDNYSHKGEG